MTTQYLEVEMDAVYGVLVRQYTASGAVDLVLAGLVLIIVIALTFAIIRWWNYIEDFVVMPCIIVVMLAGISVYLGVYGFMHIYNPEYYAIREIMEVLAR